MPLPKALTTTKRGRKKKAGSASPAPEAVFNFLDEFKRDVSPLLAAPAPAQAQAPEQASTEG